MGAFDTPSQIIRALRDQRTICNDAVAQAISTIGQVKSYGMGDFIDRQGAIGTELYYVISGSVDVRIYGHLYCTRTRNDLIGEMAVIEPGARRSADLIASDEDTHLFVVQAADFLSVAEEHGAIWECIAKELSCRLRQRDRMFVPPNSKPTIFIASSSEGSTVLKKAVDLLSSDDREIRPWNKAGIFRPTLNTLEELEHQAREVDFAVIVVTSTDDITESRGRLSITPRDNVIFESGLFMGALERERVFLLVEQDADLRLPSDFNGVTALFFKDDAELNNKVKEIEDVIRRKRQMLRYCKVL